MKSMGVRPASERFSRLAGSWVGLTVIFFVGSVCLTGAALVLDKQLHEEALASVRQEGEVIATLVTQGEITNAEVTSGVTPEAERRMQDRVEALRSQGRILGFQIWSDQRGFLFAFPASSDALSAEIAREVRQGRDFVALDQRHGPLRTDDVVVGLDLDLDQEQDVIGVVLLPPSRLDSLRAEAQTQIGWGGGFLALLLAGTLALSRHRQVRREHTARHDHLTGLGNRTFLAEEAHRRRGSPYALLLLDLDGFKNVNDTLGHGAGDELLVQVAVALQAAVRHDDQVIRLGGDEFTILLDGIIEPEHAVHAAQGVLESLAATGFSVRGIELDVHASIGVAVNGTGAFGASILLRHADVAMYKAKENGAGVVLYSKDIDHHDTDRLATLGELRRAIDRDELFLHYQPLVAVIPGTDAGAVGTASRNNVVVTSVEALVRWQHPERGVLTPEAFIPAAEHTQLIHSVTALVLDQAIAQAVSWRRSGLDLTVSVNLSPRAIIGSLVSLILSTLHRHNLPASRLKLEITETALTNDATTTIRVLRELRAAGIQISLDDFGAGYTSLAYLTTLPLTELKIDRSFVEAVGKQADTHAVVAALIELGHRLGLTVVAEGVETQAISNELTALGCDSIQGFLYSQPLAAGQMEGWVAASTRNQRPPR